MVALVEAKVSVGRLWAFLMELELDDPPISVKGEVRYRALPRGARRQLTGWRGRGSMLGQIRMRMSDASFSWVSSVRVRLAMLAASARADLRPRAQGGRPILPRRTARRSPLCRTCQWRSTVASWS